MSYRSVYRDYLFDSETGILLKVGIDDKKHLIHKQDDVPALDKEMYEEYKDSIRLIFISTQNRLLFVVTGSVFNEHKVFIDWGFGGQFFLPKQYWEIKGEQHTELTLKDELKKREIELLKSKPMTFDEISSALMVEPMQKCSYERGRQIMIDKIAGRLSIKPMKQQ